MKFRSAHALLLISGFLLVACGSGGSSDSGTDTDTTEPNWRYNVFEEASRFKNRCESPRTGRDINGNTYADVAGSTLEEMHWLRSWSNNTYLWYDEIDDENPASYSDPISYFDILKSTVTTSSGQDRDRFHYAQDTAEYQQLIAGSSNASYGAYFEWIQTYPPREARILYVEPDSPADLAGLRRGTEVISVDEADLVYGDDIDTFLAGMYPEENDETHRFVVRHIDESDTQNVTLTSQVVTRTPVQNTRVIETSVGKVGYFTLNTFGVSTAEAAMKDAFDTLAAEEINDLVVDLRYNGGGYLALSAQLGYMIAGSLTEGRTFEKTVFNDKHPTINPVTGGTISERGFLSTGIGFSVDNGEPLPTLDLNRVFILSTDRTCSASESLINGLRGIDVEVVLIGASTCGKPYGFYPTDNCGVTYSTIQFRGENEKSFGDYADGFTPENSVDDIAGEFITGCRVDDDLNHALGDRLEAMLNAALDYQIGAGCPAPPVPPVVYRTVPADQQANDVKHDARFVKRSLETQIRMDALRIAD